MNYTAKPAGSNEMIKMAGRSVTFGKPRDFPTYGWDNEYGVETIEYGYCVIVMVCLISTISDIV